MPYFEFPSFLSHFLSQPYLGSHRCVGGSDRAFQCHASPYSADSQNNKQKDTVNSLKHLIETPPVLCSEQESKMWY